MSEDLSAVTYEFNFPCVCVRFRSHQGRCRRCMFSLCVSSSLLPKCQLSDTKWLTLESRSIAIPWFVHWSALISSAIKCETRAPSDWFMWMNPQVRCVTVPVEICLKDWSVFLREVCVRLYMQSSRLRTQTTSSCNRGIVWFSALAALRLVTPFVHLHARWAQWRVMHMQIERRQPASAPTVSGLIYDHWFFTEPSDSDRHIK